MAKFEELLWTNRAGSCAIHFTQLGQKSVLTLHKKLEVN